MEQPASNDRALTLDEAVSVAVALQQARQLTAAADIYSTVLEVAPNHAYALHFSGCSPISRRAARKQSR